MNNDSSTQRWIFRSAVVLGVFALVAVTLVARALQLHVNDGAFLNAQGDARHLRVVEVAAHRGMILDRNGEPLAASTPVDSVWANPAELLESGRIDEAAGALEFEPARLRELLETRRDRPFVWLRRHLSPDEAQDIIEAGIPGVHRLREYRRYYPAAEVTAHLLGFTNIDDAGQEGVELAFDEWLRGEPGSKRVLRDRMGGIVADVQSLVQPRPGRDLQLSLDRRIQYLAYRELSTTVAAHGARGGSLVMLDARTGEVLAMVNQPGFNPNNRQDRLAERYRNRAFTDVLEPGSAFKPFVLAAGIASGRLHRASRIDTGSGILQVRGGTVTDPEALGVIDLATLLSRSSNVGASRVALALDPEQLWSLLQAFGFGQVTASGFPGEQSGQLNHYMHWRELGQATLSYGYGLSVTPVQLAQAYATLAADGVRHAVTLVRADAPTEGVRVLSVSVARDIRTLMEAGIRDGGTAALAAIPGYRVAGKTGTVRKAVNGAYVSDRHYAVFAGIAPASAPRLVVVVVIDEPTRGEYYGSRVAAPVFSRVMAGALRLMDIPPDDLGLPRTVVASERRP